MVWSALVYKRFAALGQPPLCNSADKVAYFRLSTVEHPTSHNSVHPSDLNRVDVWSFNEIVNGLDRQTSAAAAYSLKEQRLAPT